MPIPCFLVLLWCIVINQENKSWSYFGSTLANGLLLCCKLGPNFSSEKSGPVGERMKSFDVYVQYNG